METTTRRPVIGVSGHAGPARWAMFDKQVTLMPLDILERVAAVGCVPVLLPPLPGVEDCLDRLDGLLLPGGMDIDPARYGAERHPECRPFAPLRDTAEIALLRAAVRTGLPVLGVCRGLQVLNVALGGTLDQWVPGLVGHDRHCPGHDVAGAVEVRTEPRSRVAAVLGAGPLTVPCKHVQVLDRLGTGVRPTAWSADGLVEAAEVDGHPFAVGVQWHAEESGDDSLFVALADAARRHRSPGGSAAPAARAGSAVPARPAIPAASAVLAGGPERDA